MIRCGGCWDGGSGHGGVAAEKAADNTTKHYMHPPSQGMHDNYYQEN